MTFEELLKACNTGVLPRVSNGQIEGTVVVIKNNNSAKGCSVEFDHGPGYDIWFHAEDGHDLRKSYMKNLILIK